MSNDNTDPGPTDAGFVPQLGADPSSARYELLTAPQAVQRIAAVGFDRADAEHMVAEYLTRNTAEHGEPRGGWMIDPYDLAEIARGYEWVDHYRGESIADARGRAAGYATDAAHRAAEVDRDAEPGRAGRLDREVALWAERAHPATSTDDTDSSADAGREGPAHDGDLDGDGGGGPGGSVAAPDPVGPVGPADSSAGGTPLVGDPADAYTEDELCDIIRADARGDDAEVDRIQNGRARPSSVLDVADDELPTAEQTARSALVVSASWALAARDIAIERGDTEYATRFTHNAREAITAAEAAGITREQLAAELDYPGGAAELDGEHIEVGIESGRPHTAAQLAVLDAAWDEAMGLTPTATPPQHPDDIWGPIQAGRGDDEAAASPEVVGLVCPECEEDVTEQAPTTLAPYEAHGMERPAYSHLDGEPLCPVMGPRGYQPADPMEVHTQASVEQAHRTVSEAPAFEDGPDRPDRENGGGGVPTAGWGPDRSDLAAIAAEQRVAAAHDAVTQTGTEPGRTTQQAEETTEQDRRAQLAAWAHADTTDDHTVDHTGRTEHGLEQQR